MIALSNMYIKDAYQTIVRPILHKNGLRAYFKSINPKLEEEINTIWNKNKDAYHPCDDLTDKMIDLIIKKLGSVYKEFAKRVDKHLAKLVSIKKDDFENNNFDFTIFDHIRVISNSTPLPDFYKRKNIKDVTPVGSSLRNWEKISEKEARKSDILTLNYTGTGMAYQRQYKVLEHIYVLVVREMFDSMSSAVDTKLRGSALIIPVEEWLSGMRKKDGLSLYSENTYVWDNPYTEYRLVEQMAGLFGYLYGRKNEKKRLAENIKDDCTKVFNYLNQALRADKYKYIEEFLCRGNIPYWRLDYCILLNKRKDVLDGWAKESLNKAIYVALFEYDKNENDLMPTPSDYFSYSRMVQLLPNWNEKFKFPTKKAMRRTFELDSEVFSIIMLELRHGNLNANRGCKGYEKITWNYWRNIVLWLENTSKHPEISLDVLRSINNWVKQLFNGSEINYEVEERIPLAIDLIYEYKKNLTKIESDKKDHSTEIRDYLEGYEYGYRKDGRIFRTRKRNILSISKTTTVKSLMRKVSEWHKEGELYNQLMLLKKENRYKEQVYEQFQDTEVVIGECRFALIRNHLDLLLEGVTMHHCVETYHQRIRKGGYVVFKGEILSMNGDLNNRFTLGLWVENGKVEIDQCKGIRNHSVDGRAIVDSVSLVTQINSKQVMIFSDATPSIEVGSELECE